MSGAIVSAENTETTWYSPDIGQYSASTLSPSGYCHAARRIRAASRSAAGTAGAELSNATNSVWATLPNPSGGAEEALAPVPRGTTNRPGPASEPRA